MPHAPLTGGVAGVHPQFPVPLQGGQPVPGPACSGPQCQRDHQTPDAPNKVVQVPTYSDGILASIAALNCVEVQVCHPSADADRGESPAGRIFRPPRAAC
jgi:hypothetical protein